MSQPSRWVRAWVAVLLSSASVTAQRGTLAGEWPTYGGDLGHPLYAPLDQITGAHVAALSLGTSIGHAPAPAPSARMAAEAWVMLIDRGQSDESWRQAAASFKRVTTPQQWSASVQKVRRVLGPLTSRSFRGSATTDVLPTGQRGQFVILQFDSVFQQRLGTTFETIATVQEPDGQWRVVWHDVK